MSIDSRPLYRNYPSIEFKLSKMHPEFLNCLRVYPVFNVYTSHALFKAFF